MPEMGHTLPRLGFKMDPLSAGDTMSVIFSDFVENPGPGMGIRNGPISAT